MIFFTDMQAAGLLPTFLNPEDSRGAVAQIDESYAHGGGWRDFEGFELSETSDGSKRLQYPDDPPYIERSRATLRDELIVLFDNAWCAVIQLDGSYKVARLD